MGAVPPRKNLAIPYFQNNRLTIKEGKMGFIISLITWIVLGFIIGALAKFILPGRDPGGFLVTTLVGIAGAFLGGFISSLIGLGGFTGFNFWSIVFGVIGAILLLVIYRLLRR
jgi:uncharacterized membrane protein YeaQ/YmgE (transglycosylase-associated protein family)